VITFRPNCNTTYYYAIRAFDIYGNGSDVRGDSNTTTNVTTTTTTTTTNGQRSKFRSENKSGSKTVNSSEAAKEVLGATESAKVNNGGNANPTTPS